MMKVLVVVDMQNDFIDGPLGTKEAVTAVPRVMEKISGFEGKVLATRDTHEPDYLDTLEGKGLPVEHCIRGTYGWKLRPVIGNLIREQPIDKNTFGSVELGKYLQFCHKKKEPIESITLVGLCTDICVISNAMLLKAFLPEVRIVVDAYCCAGTTPEGHRRALETMKACQIIVENE